MEATGFEPANLLTASQALYQLSYAPEMLPSDHQTTFLAPAAVSGPDQAHP